MKYSLIATIVVLALAQGSFAQDATDMEKLGKFFEDMKTKMTEELTSIYNNKELSAQAQTYLQDKKAELEPIAAQLQEQLMSASATIQEQIAPMADSVKTQFQPLFENFQKQMEDVFKKLAEQTQPIAN